jgi:hypothetical protein
METTQVVIFAGLALYVVATQLGRHALSWYRFLAPLAICVAVSLLYLKSVPTVGGDLTFDVVCVLAGLACGLLASSLVRMERDPSTGRLVTRAGLAYAAVWLAVFGGRIAFGYAATGVWQQAVVRFSINHAITSQAAWTAAFILMAIAMVLARTLVMAVRTLALSAGARMQTA